MVNGCIAGGSILCCSVSPTIVENIKYSRFILLGNQRREEKVGDTFSNVSRYPNTIKWSEAFMLPSGNQRAQKGPPRLQRPGKIRRAFLDHEKHMLGHGLAVSTNLNWTCSRGKGNDQGPQFSHIARKIPMVYRACTDYTSIVIDDSKTCASQKEMVWPLNRSICPNCTTRYRVRRAWHGRRPYVVIPSVFGFRAYA